jgi:hypothetical protein
MSSQTVNIKFADFKTGGTFVGTDGLPSDAPTTFTPATGSPISIVGTQSWALQVDELVPDGGQSGTPALLRQTLVVDIDTAIYTRYFNGLSGQPWTSWQQVPA